MPIDAISFFNDFIEREYEAHTVFATEPDNDLADAKTAEVRAMRPSAMRPNLQRYGDFDPDTMSSYAEGGPRKLFAVVDHGPNHAVAYVGVVNREPLRGRLSGRIVAERTDEGWKNCHYQLPCRKCRGADKPCTGCHGHRWNALKFGEPVELPAVTQVHVFETPSMAVSAPLWAQLETHRGEAWRSIPVA